MSIECWGFVSSHVMSGLGSIEPLRNRVADYRTPSETEEFDMHCMRFWYWEDETMIVVLLDVLPFYDLQELVFTREGSLNGLPRIVQEWDEDMGWRSEDDIYLDLDELSAALILFLQMELSEDTCYGIQHLQQAITFCKDTGVKLMVLHEYDMGCDVD